MYPFPNPIAVKIIPNVLKHVKISSLHLHKIVNSCSYALLSRIGHSYSCIILTRPLMSGSHSAQKDILTE